MRVDRPPVVVEAERRVGLREHDVGVVERLDRADVGPVAVVQVGHDAIALERGGNQLATEVDAGFALEQIEQHRRA